MSAKCKGGSEAEPVPNANCGQDLLSDGRSIPLGDGTERFFILHLALITSHLALNSVTESSQSKYWNPPEHALVSSCDEKSQIQALDRTQKSLPLFPGRLKTMTHDDKRNGTTTLFAAIELAEGKIIAECQPRHRHQERLKFRKKIDAETPPKIDPHLIVDNYATHKHPKVLAWLQRHPRFHLHFTPTSRSWLNRVPACGCERWFRDITQNRIRNGVFRSVAELEQAITDDIQHHNANPKTFVWTKKAEDILEKVRRARIALDKLPSV